MAQTLLADVLADILAEAAIALDSTDGADPAPDYQVVKHGQATVDCPDMLAVLWDRVSPKTQANPRLQKCVIVTQVLVRVRLQRCTPEITDKQPIPAAAAVTAASLQLATDLQAIWKHLTGLVAGGEWPVGNSCDRVGFSHIEPTPPSGGSQGGDILLTVTL